MRRVRNVHVLFEEDRDGWAIHGWKQHLDSNLEKALRDGEMARKEAGEMSTFSFHVDFVNTGISARATQVEPSTLSKF